MLCVHILLASLPLLVAGTAHETPQQVVTRYNNYKAICTGLGYENLGCKDSTSYYPILTVKSETVVFQSSLTKTMANMKNEETVIFDNVSLNEGKAYDRTTGKFTAPSDGVFSFTWATLTKGGQYFITEIVHNGQRMAYNHNDGRGIETYSMSSSHANIKLKKGDKVWIRTHENYGQFVYGANYCNFSGVKL